MKVVYDYAPMDFRNMRSLGVRSLPVHCHRCHIDVVTNADRWPDDMVIGVIAPRLICSKCGAKGTDVDLRSNLREHEANRASSSDQRQPL